MANFLDDLSVYNAKAALAISQAVSDGNTDKANMMSSLKTTANDTTLTEAIRLNALTALINLGSLLDIPLPPYFPLTTTYANTQTYVGIHDDLTGLQGGAPGEYYHVTLAERNSIANAATVGDISFINLSGSYTDNVSLVNAFAGKQDVLSGTGFVKISGTTISYDNSTYLSSISGIAAGGELSGTYPSPTLSNAAVISKVLTGFTGTSLPIQITSADSILSAIQKLNNNIASLIVSPSGVASVALTTNSSGVFTTTTTPQTGAAVLDVSLNTQTASKFLASPTSTSGTPTFRAFSSIDLPDSGATEGAYGSSSLIPRITVDAKGRITAISTVAAAAGGQVNSVTLTIPSIFGPVTNTGTASAVNLTYILANQTANYVWAGPVSGAAAVPAFRLLVSDDIPSLPTSKITGLTNILDGYLTDSLSEGSIWIGNKSNAAVQRVLSGDVTVTFEGVTAIGAAKVQYSMIQDVTTQTLLGRYDAVDGEVQQITLSGDFVLDSGTGVLSLDAPVAPVVTTKGDLLGHDLTSQARVPSSNVDGDILLVNNSATGTYTDLGLNWVTMSGDATINATGAITIANGAVSLGKMANLAANRIIGNNTGSSATPLALTGTQVTAMLDQFSTTAKGLVPAASGVNDTTKYLRGDGSWQAITGTGTVTQVSVATINGFAGTVNNDTTTPEIEIELDSLTGVLKGTGIGIALAIAGTGGDYISPGQITQTTGAGSGLTMASGNLLGRTTASAGAIEAISVNSSLTLAATTLGLNLGNGNVFTVQQQMPSLRLNGSTSGFISFTPPATAGAQAYTLPSAFPGTGTTGYLKSTDAGVLTWDTATGTTTASVTFDAVAGNTAPKVFNGSQAMTIGYATVGAQQANANLTGLSGLTYASGSPLVRMTGAGTFTLDGATYVTGTATQYAVLVGGAGNSIASITPVASNKLLISNGTSANPGWTDASYLATTTQYGILYSSSPNVVSEILPPGSSGLYLQWTGSGYTWASGGGGGGGGTTTNSLIINNSGAEDSSGITFNGSASVTISSNTILPSFTGNAGYALVVNGTSDNVQWSPVGNVTGAGNAGRVAYWDSGSNITGSADFYWDNSTKFLGIGTTTPECGLHVTTTGSQNIKGIMNMHYDNTASAQAKYIGARARGNNPNNPSALQTDDAITSLSGRGYKATTWSNTVGGYYVYAAENWTDAATGTYLTFRGVVSGGTTVSEWARLTSSSTLVELALGQSSTKSGGLLLYSSGGAFTTRLQASPSASSSETYILPATDGTSGQLLSTDGNGVMSWITGIGSGDVVGPSSATDGDFVVFDGTTGKLIKEPLNASLTAAGRATFNSGVDVGVSGPTGTTGTLVFRNSSNAFTTTLQQSTSSTGNATYTWPIAPGTAGQILSTDNSGNLSWTNAGAGNVTTSGIGQVITGSIFFLSNIQVRDSGQTRNITLAAPTTGGTGSATITFPVLTGTVALLDNTQTFTGAKTFDGTGGTITFSRAASAGTAITISGTGAATTAQVTFSGGTMNWMNFGTTGAAAPVSVFTPANRSAGTKIVLYPNSSTGDYDVALGVSASNAMWLSSNTISFYAGGSTTVEVNGRFEYGGGGALRGLRLASNNISTNNNSLLFIGGGATNACGYIEFSTAATATGACTSPTTTRSAGTKLLFQSAFGTAGLDAAIGVNTSSEVWFAAHNYTNGFRFYTNDSTTPRLTINNNGLTLTDATTVALIAATATTANVFNTVATTVNFAGAATTLTIGNTATAAQTVNMFTASTGASTYNFATGATASATTKAINIGTGGAAGSTTNITFGTSTTTNLRFFGSTNTSGKPTVTGSRGGNAALASFLTALSNLGLITDSTTA